VTGPAPTPPNGASTASRSLRLDADYLIAGAGLSGLSLAVHLADAGLDGRRVIIVDPKTAFRNDRTWCSWRVLDHPFMDAVSHEWTRWRVRDDRRDVVRGNQSHPYQLVPGDRFYRLARERLAREPGVTLELGCGVSEIDDRGDHVRVETSGGPLRVRAVFDSRPPRNIRPKEGSGWNPVDEIHLAQHFRGWFVTTERPVFDPDVPMLMDFGVSQAEGVHFIYVLPMDPHRALVEDTFFTEHLLEREAYEANLRSYLDAVRTDGYRIDHEEAGVIPMSTASFPARTSPRVYRLGLAGGMAKPSTGYAFLNVQRYSQALAARLKADPLPEPPAVRSTKAAAMDRIFLSYLAKNPDRGAEVFVDLFEKVPPAGLVRFLTETGSMADLLRVMTAMPRRSMTMETFRSTGLWLRAP